MQIYSLLCLQSLTWELPNVILNFTEDLLIWKKQLVAKWKSNSLSYRETKGTEV